MAKKKVTPYLEKLVFKEKKSKPYLGVRALSDLIKKRHEIIISKSTISKILKKSGVQEQSGRKKAILIYKTKGVENCGLLLLRALDHRIGLFSHIRDEIKVYFPKINKDLLKKLIILATFSSMLRDKLKFNIRRNGFLRLAGIKHSPARKLDYFENRIIQYRPQVNLKPVKENLRLASTIKFYFNDGSISYCDAKMSTLWDGPCYFEHFFLPLKGAMNSVLRMLKDKAIMVGYTKSFGYLSLLTCNFLKGIASGIKKIQFLDEEGDILETVQVGLASVSFFIGYYPKALSKGMSSIGKSKKFKRFFWDELGEFSCSNILTRFFQSKTKKGLILNNFSIKKKANSSPSWGILTTANVSNIKVNLGAFFKKYLYLYPFMEEGFLEDMKVIEKKGSILKKKKEGLLEKILPQKLNFTELADFARVGQILSVIFKEVIWGWEPKGKSGDFTIGKDYLKISLNKAPKEVGRNFNKACLYIGNKRVFLV